ncbi:MAG: ATP-dependent RNA helicase DeaD [Rhodobacteraceae bacterium HLUCCA12]|nr:MAG: ATP-dependent RNA helicase DeaD [Rhodobacteraceae bacterium HLUCCA12]
MTTALPTGANLPAPLAQALADKGYDSLTSVQAAVLDPGRAGHDLLVSAQTGSGKTVAFGLAMAADLMDDSASFSAPDAPRALIIAPTRELALQVQRELAWLYAPAGAVIASCVGGMDPRTERRALERGAHLVVGTPGRLRDHLERGALDLAALQVAVLDEADEMLDLGFREDLEFILQSAAPERRTLMFSATVSPQIERLAQTYQRAAQRVVATALRDAHADISYRALTVAPAETENAIVNVLRYYEARNALVFCKTRAMVNHLTARFNNRGFAVVALSGELAQDERARALQMMRDGRARVCVATDVAARGIDLPGLELVIHADLPSNREALLHRSGRTGRAGQKGVSVLIVPFPARRRTERLLQSAGVAAEWGPAPTAAEVSARDHERLLADPALTAPESPEEQALITMMIERFTPRELAAGVLRQYFAARSAPEDIAPVTPDGPRPQPRTEFNRSIWIRLGIGTRDRAEPRWLLPMLCRTGNLGKTDIGAIRLFDDHTLVQLHADSEERFFHAVGADGQLEQGITVSRAAPPDPARRPDRRPAEKASSPRPRPSAPREAAPARPDPSDDRKPRPHGGTAAKGRQGADAPPRPARPQRRDERAPRSDDAPARPQTPQPAREKPPAAKPSATPRPRFDAAAARNPSARLDAPGTKGKPKHGAKPGGKPKGGPKRPAGPGAKPARGGNARPSRPPRKG